MVPASSVSRAHPTLPAFRLDDDTRAIFYTPGEVLVTSHARADVVQAALLGRATATPSPEEDILRSTVMERARVAEQNWRAFTAQAFEPECLTLYLSNQCNLACSYCFSAPANAGLPGTRLPMAGDIDGHRALPLLSEAAVAAASRYVARHCAAKNKPFHLVVHGGGEPTLHWSLLERVRGIIGRVADEHGLPLWAYIATHGVFGQERARWLARHFTCIGLSCDGPPDIHDANRPTASGAPTSAIVERTARVFAEEGVEYHVRVTVTPANVHRQCEIVDYVCDHLRARTIRLEPAYDGRRTKAPHFETHDADAFVEGFLDAAAHARRKGCNLQVSGIRHHEIHAAYCNPLRQVLQLTPDGVATACFLNTGSRDPAEAEMALGRYDSETDTFVVDQGRVAQLRQLAARIPSRCQQCVNVYHCVRDCPDVCVMTANPVDELEGGFRCRVQKRLGREWILEMAQFAQV